MLVPHISLHSEYFANKRSGSLVFWNIYIFTYAYKCVCRYREGENTEIKAYKHLPSESLPPGIVKCIHVVEQFVLKNSVRESTVKKPSPH